MKKKIIVFIVATVIMSAAGCQKTDGSEAVDVVVTSERSAGAGSILDIPTEKMTNVQSVETAD